MMNEALEKGGELFVGPDGIQRVNLMGTGVKDAQGQGFYSIMVPELKATAPTLGQLGGDISRGITGYNTLEYTDPQKNQVSMVEKGGLADALAKVAIPGSMAFNLVQDLYGKGKNFLFPQEEDDESSAADATGGASVMGLGDIRTAQNLANTRSSDLVAFLRGDTSVNPNVQVGSFEPNTPFISVRNPNTGETEFMMDPDPGLARAVLGDETINFDDLEERMRQDTSLLTKIQEQSSKEQLSVDEQMNKTLDDQYTISQSINAEVAQIQNILTEAAASGAFGITAKELALANKELVQGELSGLIDDNVMQGIKGFVQSDAFLDPAQMAELDELDNPTTGNDFVIRPGGDLRRFSEGSLSLATNPKDTIVGGTNLFQETTNRISNMSNLMTTNNMGGRNTDTINVRVSFDKPLTMSLDGQLSNMKLSASQVERAMESTGFIQNLINKTFQANGPVG